MGLGLDSDLVLDVIRAGNPERVAKAREKLETMRASVTAPKPAQEFSALTGNVRPTANNTRVTKAGTAEQKFEAYILQNFLEAMLPKNNDAVYGAGLAGDMWKSMLAEEISSTVAANGRLGLANRLLGDVVAREDAKVESIAGARDSTTAVTESRQADILKSYVANQQRILVDRMNTHDRI